VNRHFLRLTKLCFVAILIFVVGNAASKDPPGLPDAEIDAALADVWSNNPVTSERGLRALPGFVRLRNTPKLNAIIPAIAAELNNPNSRIRSAAADAALEIVTTMPHLKRRFSFDRILFDQDQGLKLHVLWECHNNRILFDAGEVAIMAQILPLSSTEIRFAIYANFSKLGNTYVPGLNNKAIAWAAPAMLNMIDREIRENATASTGGSVAGQALHTLGVVGRGSSRCVPKLIALYEQFAGGGPANRERQREILSAIGYSGTTSDQSLPFLLRLLKDRTASLADRSYAAGAIGIYGPLAATAVGPMTDLLREAVVARAPLPVVSSITDGLRRLGDEAEPAIPLLLALAEGPEDSPATAAAVESLRDLAPVAIDRSARVFASLLYREKRHRLERELAVGLATFRSAGLPYTIAALEHPTPVVLHNAFTVLHMCGPEAVAAVPALQKLVDKRTKGWESAEILLRKFRRVPCSRLCVSM